MSSMSLFFKRNKAPKENARYAATKSLRGEGGEPLEWELRPIPPKEYERIMDDCTKEIPLPGKPNRFRSKTDRTFVGKLLAASVVVPDLMDAELQDSYGVREPDDLVKAMVDDLGEYQALAAFVQKLSGLDADPDDLAGKAKN